MRVTRVADQAGTQLTALLNGVEGWLTDAQAARLARCAAATGAGERIVEIGSFRGRSTIALASSAPPGVEVIAIDPHAGNDRGPQQIEGFEAEANMDHDVFHANLQRAGVDDRVQHVAASSAHAHEKVAAPIDLLFIDGAHRYRPALDDIRRWGSKVRPGGAMLIHDSFNAMGVVGAQAVALAASGRFHYVGRTGSLAEYRAQPVGPRGRARNVLRHVGELPYVARNQLVKVLILLGLGRLTPLLGQPAGRWPY